MRTLSWTHDSFCAECRCNRRDKGGYDMKYRSSPNVRFSLHLKCSVRTRWNTISALHKIPEQHLLKDTHYHLDVPLVSPKLGCKILVLPLAGRIAAEYDMVQTLCCLYGLISQRYVAVKDWLTTRDCASQAVGHGIHSAQPRAAVCGVDAVALCWCTQCPHYWIECFDDISVHDLHSRLEL